MLGKRDTDCTSCYHRCHFNFVRYQSLVVFSHSTKTISFYSLFIADFLVVMSSDLMTSKVPCIAIKMKQSKCSQSLCSPTQTIEVLLQPLHFNFHQRPSHLGLNLKVIHLAIDVGRELPLAIHKGYKNEHGSRSPDNVVIKMGPKEN